MPVNNKRFLLNSILLILLVLQISVIYISYQCIQQLSRSNRLVAQSFEVMNSINVLRASVLEIQNAQRGYVITGESNQFVEYNRSISSLFQKFSLLSDLVSDNPRQVRRCAQLIPLLKERVSFSNDIINVFKKQGFIQAQNLIKTDKGIIITMRVQTITNEMITEELMLLQGRNHVLAEKTALTENYLVATIITTFCFLTGLFILINFQHSRQIHVEKKRKEVESQLKGIIEGTTDAIAAIDNDYNFITFNKAFKKDFRNLFGIQISVGMNIKEILSALPEFEKLEHFLDLWRRALQGEEFTIITQLGINDKAYSFEVTSSLIHNNQQEIIGASQILRNVTERLEQAKKLTHSNLDLAEGMAEIKKKNQAISLLNSLSSTLQTCLTVEETFSAITTYCVKILPKTNGMLYLSHPSGNYMNAVMQWGAPHEQEEVISPTQCWALRRGQIHRYFDSENSISCKHVQNTENISPYLCLPLQAQNESIGLLYVEFNEVGSHNSDDIQRYFSDYELMINTIAETIALSLANIKLRDTLKIRSIRDSLTGLFNRTYLEESFGRELLRAQRQNNKLAVVMMDLDHFKTINDTFGHEAGDLVLKEVGKLLLEETRNSDIACRYGGEEILLLFFDISNGEDAVKRVDTIREKISRIKVVHHGEIVAPIRASFGIALLPNHGLEPTALVEAADTALYQSKKNGRNLVSLAPEPVRN